MSAGSSENLQQSGARVDTEKHQKDFMHRFQTGTALTVIVTLAKQLQETEEVTGELVVRHHLLIYQEKLNKEQVRYILRKGSNLTDTMTKTLTSEY